MTVMKANVMPAQDERHVTCLCGETGVIVRLASVKKEHPVSDLHTDRVRFSGSCSTCGRPIELLIRPWREGKS